MPWVPAVAAVAGSLISSDASRSAANTQSDSAKQASATEKAMYDQTTQNVSPWLDAGKSSLAKLMSGINDGSLMPSSYTPFTADMFHSSPGYEFQLQQGKNAITNQMSLSGGANSNNLKGLIGYSQGLADQDFQTQLNNYMSQFQLGNQVRQQGYNNLAGISASGLGAGLQQGQIGAQVGQNIGSNIIGAGNAQAAGTMGAANAYTNGIGQGYNAWLQNQYMNRNPGTGNPTWDNSAWGNYGDASTAGPPKSAMTPAPAPTDSGLIST